MAIKLPIIQINHRFSWWVKPLVNHHKIRTSMSCCCRARMASMATRCAQQCAATSRPRRGGGENNSWVDLGWFDDSQGWLLENIGFTPVCKRKNSIHHQEIWLDNDMLCWPRTFLFWSASWEEMNPGCCISHWCYSKTSAGHTSLAPRGIRACTILSSLAPLSVATRICAVDAHQL